MLSYWFFSLKRLQQSIVFLHLLCSFLLGVMFLAEYCLAPPLIVTSVNIQTFNF